MFEKIQAAAEALSLFQSMVGIILALFAVRLTNKWTLGPTSWLKVVLTPLHVATILILFFFFYATVIHLPFERWLTRLS